MDYDIRQDSPYAYDDFHHYRQLIPAVHCGSGILAAAQMIRAGRRGRSQDLKSPCLS
jgi:hypothetical protein